VEQVVAANDFGAWVKGSNADGGDRVAFGTLGGRRVLAVLPSAFMNLSGRGVAKLAAKHGVDPSRLLVAHDDLDLACGRLKIKQGGSSGGHKGLDSCSTCLRSTDYWRLRIGIGRPVRKEDVPDFVLERFTPTEHSALSTLFELLAGPEHGARLPEVRLRDSRNGLQSSVPSCPLHTRPHPVPCRLHLPQVCLGTEAERSRLLSATAAALAASAVAPAPAAPAEAAKAKAAKAKAAPAKAAPAKAAAAAAAPAAAPQLPPQAAPLLPPPVAPPAFAAGQKANASAAGVGQTANTDAAAVGQEADASAAGQKAKGRRSQCAAADEVGYEPPSKRQQSWGSTSLARALPDAGPAQWECVGKSAPGEAGG